MIRRALTGALTVALIALTPAPVAGAEQLRAPREIGPRAAPEVWPSAPPVSARSYLLLDATTGQVLAEREADVRGPVASTVKTLTAFSALRRTNTTDTIRVGSDLSMLPLDGAGVGIAPGDEWTVEELVDAVIARSGNDAALVLAEHVAGSVPAMLDLMRSDAEALGLTGMSIETVHGLGDLDRLSARDLATITRAAMEDARFASVSIRSAVQLPGIGRIRSRNLLLDSYLGADGVKTGHTLAAGRCLIASASRSGRRLIAVVLGSSDPDGHFRDARALLDHGFSRFQRLPVRHRALELRRPGAWEAYTTRPFDVLVPDIEATSRSLAVPVESGASHVQLTVSWSEQEIAAVGLEPATAASDPDSAVSWLVDRAYSAMRAAGNHDLWPADGTPTR